MSIRDTNKRIGLVKVCRDRSVRGRVGPIRDIPLETTVIKEYYLSPAGLMLHGKAFEIRQGFFHVAMKIKEKINRKEVDECNEDTLSDRRESNGYGKGWSSKKKQKS